MAAAISQAHGDQVQVETVKGSGGVFDVAIDGAMVFRKWDENRFPTNREILDEIAARRQKV